MTHPAPPPTPQPGRILVRGVNWLGDAVMTTPALRRLRERFPAAHIALLTPSKLRDLWVDHPGLDEVLTFQAGDSPFKVGQELRGHRFDLAWILPNSPRSALAAWRAGIPRRIGYVAPWRNWFLTQAVPRRPASVEMRKRTEKEIRLRLTLGNRAESFPAQAHQVFDYLHLAAAVGADASPCAPAIRLRLERLRDLLHSLGGRFPGIASPGGFIAITPGAEYGGAKRWPAARFAAAAAGALKEHPGLGVVLLGSSGDRPVCEEVAAKLGPGSPAINLAGQTTLLELMCLLKAARLLLTNDSGPMHLAAALGTPVVAIFGSTAPALTGPGLPGEPNPGVLQAHAPCSPCFLRECPIDFRCMREIEAQVVSQKATALLRHGPAPG